MMYNRFGLAKGAKVKHNYDKRLVNINLHEIATYDTVLYTASFPCVIMGIVINGTVTTKYVPTPAGTVNYQWFIIIVREGESVPPISFTGLLATSAATSITPEEHVMAFGAGAVTPDTFGPCECKTKTGRKMMSGDTVRFTMDADNTSATFSACFCIQFFLRT